jgi:hypothetical protein
MRRLELEEEHGAEAVLTRGRRHLQGNDVAPLDSAALVEAGWVCALELAPDERLADVRVAVQEHGRHALVL